MAAKRALPAKRGWLEGNIPAPLEHLVTVLMTKLAFEDSLQFLTCFTGALANSSDLSTILYKLKYWILTNEEDGLILEVSDKAIPVVMSMAHIQRLLMAGKPVNQQDVFELKAEARRLWYEGEHTSPVIWAGSDYPDATARAVMSMADRTPGKPLYYKRVADKLIALMEDEG